MAKGKTNANNLAYWQLLITLSEMNKARSLFLFTVDLENTVFSYLHE